jgi:glucose-6-phosphate isomerase
VLASKTFTTLETLANGDYAKRWLEEGLNGHDLSQHLLAVTASPEKAVAYGVAENHVFEFWDWVGGRYSLWSAIGMSIAIQHGEKAFRAMLAGAHDMDRHFKDSPLEANAPALMALLEDYYVNHCDAHSVAILPYSHRLRLLPDYLQQLCMESNGKSVTVAGDPLSQRSCPVIWGYAGTVGQHSFYQLLHQGTEFIPSDFILPLSLGLSSIDSREQHLQSNCLAQSKALYEGKPLQQAKQEMLDAGENEARSESLAKHRQVAGGKPNTLIVMPTIDAYSVGALLAMYEHKVYAQSVFWEINAFDQWGVELGKQLSKPIFASLSSSAVGSIDEVTDYWLEQLAK